MSEFAWLVERPNPTRYWTGRSQSDFTTNHAEAMRFARQIDAEHVIDWIIDIKVADMCAAVQHGWSE